MAEQRWERRSVHPLTRASVLRGGGAAQCVEPLGRQQPSPSGASVEVLAAGRGAASGSEGRERVCVCVRARFQVDGDVGGRRRAGCERAQIHVAVRGVAVGGHVPGWEA